MNSQGSWMCVFLFLGYHVQRLRSYSPLGQGQNICSGNLVRASDRYEPGWRMARELCKQGAGL